MERAGYLKRLKPVIEESDQFGPFVLPLGYKCIYKPSIYMNTVDQFICGLPLRQCHESPLYISD